MKSKLGRNVVIINLIAVVILAAGVFFISNYTSYLEQSEYRTLAAYSRIITENILNTRTVKKIPVRAANTEGAYEFGYIDSRQKLTSFSASANFLFSLDKTALHRVTDQMFIPEISFRIYDLIGNPIADGGKNRSFSYDAANTVNPILTGSRSRILGKTADGDLIIADSLYYRGKIIGALVLIGGKKTINKALTDIRKALTMTFVLSVIINLLLFIYISHKITSPLFVLAKTANAIAAEKRYDGKMPDYSSRHDEIGELSAALRKMVDTLWQRLTATETFASDISHEIKNPLSSLRAASEILSKITDDKKRDEMALIIRNDIIRLDKLVSEISSLSKLDRELVKEETEDIDICDFLNAVIEIKKIGNENLNLVCHTEKAQGISIKANGTKFAQILDNLISNAMSFSNAITVSACVKKRHLIIRVDDEGPGIPPESIKKIFERFYSSRPKGSADTHSGLGLAISQKIANAAGGRIFAVNRRPKGASFIIALGEFNRRP